MIRCHARRNATAPRHAGPSPGQTTKDRTGHREASPGNHHHRSLGPAPPSGASFFLPNRCELACSASLLFWRISKRARDVSPRPHAGWPRARRRRDGGGTYELLHRVQRVDVRRQHHEADAPRLDVHPVPPRHRAVDRLDRDVLEHDAAGDRAKRGNSRQTPAGVPSPAIGPAACASTRTPSPPSRWRPCP